jgi:hypothetical protein
VAFLFKRYPVVSRRHLESLGSVPTSGVGQREIGAVRPTVIEKADDSPPRLSTPLIPL